VRPIDLSPRGADPLAELESNPEIAWLEPLPDDRWRTAPSGPEAAAVGRETLRLAFVSALQHLTPGQRAVVLLRDVLGYSASETAQTLEVSEASANSSLQRARSRLKRLVGSEQELQRSSDLEARERDLLGRYVHAFEAYDTDAVVALLREDATWEMPPFLGWYEGREAIGTLIRTQCPAQKPRDLLFVETGANGQPAAAAYLRGADGVHRPFQIHVLDVAPGEERVRRVTCFFDAQLFATFGLPSVLGPAG
jgi:RNA polymerase sigma-70 factor (ECF subfamily)